MKYCPNCLEEYQDAVETCAECDRALVGLEEIAGRAEFRQVRPDEDTTRFVAVATADNLFDADAFTAAVADLGIPVLTQPHRSSAVDALTTGVTAPWWKICVPQEDEERARAAVAKRREELEAALPEAETAAEEEALETAK